MMASPLPGDARDDQSALSEPSPGNSSHDKTVKEPEEAQRGKAAESSHASKPSTGDILEKRTNCDASEDSGENNAREEEDASERRNAPESNTNEAAPPLADESIPPLPEEPPPPVTDVDDGWLPVWEETAQAFYFFNRFTGATQWTNPRVPEVFQPSAPGVAVPQPAKEDPFPTTRPPGGYDPAIHGDYDPTAWYAQPAEPEAPAGSVVDPAASYTATAAFNRFTGRFQAPDIGPEKFNDENKSRNQMNAFFDVDAAANSHDGRSLKAERSGKKLSKSELKQFKEKRKAKKEEKRRAWLRD